MPFSARRRGARASSHDDVPFFVFDRSQKAGSHLENGIGESSKIVPTRTENCRLHSLQRHFFRVAMACTEAEPQPMAGAGDAVRPPHGDRVLMRPVRVGEESHRFEQGFRRPVHAPSLPGDYAK